MTLPRLEFGPQEAVPAEDRGENAPRYFNECMARALKVIIDQDKNPMFHPGEFIELVAQHVHERYPAIVVRMFDRN